MMEDLLRKVKKELDTIADKGLTSSNLDTAYKLIDIYKDIREAKYYENCNEESEHYGARERDGRGRYKGEREWKEDDYGRYYPIDEREERYLNRMREALYNYDEGRNRYREGGSKEKMIDGVDMAMGALVNFVEFMLDNVETAQEKEVVRKHIEKLKKL